MKIKTFDMCTLPATDFMAIADLKEGDICKFKDGMKKIKKTASGKFRWEVMKK